MNTSCTESRAVKAFIGVASGALLSCLLLANAYGAATLLASEPFTSSDKIPASPNLMFILDDSGSMQYDYLPDWAGPYQQTISGVLTTVTPEYLFFNGTYNGVAYNPSAKPYLPPVMYTSSGALDTTTYPSQNGQSVASGGTVSASAAAPNWRAVKVDGYGIQSSATVNLEDAGKAFSYTTIAGEYCDSAQLRNCVAATAPTGIYTFPAKLRWCTTAAAAIATTATAGTKCQASNIADTPTNTANGVTTYTFPRIAQPHTSTLTVTGFATAVTSILVGTKQILSSDSVGAGSSVDLAAAIAASINACTWVKTGTCDVVGFSAVSASNVVTVTAPAPTTATPVITGGTMTKTQFANGSSVPGGNYFTVITSSLASYPDPGSSVKSANRSDCAGTTCTYAEEMTNYANWYAYYRTRMQMMKTASSIAFSAVDGKFRVGYYSINNGASSQFLNVGAFNGAQKNLWYAKFLSARPYGATPLRTGLATIGQMYAGQLSTLNGVDVSEPMQYSCQQNFTILSTDGYWNDSALPTRIDRTTPIGQQDGNLDRPYYDGGKQTMTVSQTLQSFQQKGKYEYFVESQTRQLQTSTSQLAQEVTTTTRQPWEIQTSHLQTRTKDLTKNTYNLESRTYPLVTTTSVLRENTYKPKSTTNRVVQTTNYLQETTTNLTKTITKVDRVTNKLQVGTQDITSITSPLQIRTRATTRTTANLQIKTRATTQTTTPVQIRTQGTRYAITPVLMQTQPVTYTTTPVQKKTQAVTYTTTPVQIRTQRVTATTSPLQQGSQGVLVAISPLQSTTTNLVSTNFKLQKRSLKLNSVGDGYYDTNWVDVTSGSCTTFVGVKWTDPEYNVTCQYVPAGVTSALSSCTPHAKSTSSPYTVLTANTCDYESTPVVAAAATCTVQAPMSTTTNGVAAKAAVTCAYGAAAAATSTPSCVAKNETGAASMTGDKKVCSYDGTVSWGATTVATCSPSDPNYASAKISCRYGTAGAAVVGTCAANDQTASLATNGASISGNKVECGVESTPVFADATGTTPSCAPKNEVYSTGVARVTCQLGTALATQTGACSKNDQGSSLDSIGTTYYNKVVCGLDSTASFADVASGGSCTPTAVSDATNAAGTAKVSCQLGTAAAAQTGACTKNNPGTSLTTVGTAYKAKVVCGFDASSSYVAPTGGSCTPTAAATDATNAAGTAKVLCKLAAAELTPAAGKCVANLASTTAGTALTSTSTAYKDKVVCSLDPAPVFADATNSPRSCTPKAADYPNGTAEVTCQLGTALAAQNGACTANDQGSSLNNSTTTYKDKVVCGLATASFADVGGATPTCTPQAAVYASGTSEITCQYGSPGSATAGTCNAKDQTTSLTSNGTLISGNQVVCGLANANFVNASGTPPTCTPRAADYPGGVAEISCQYGTAGSAVVGACVAKDQTVLLTTIGAALSGNKVVCDVGTTYWVDATGSPPTCTPNPVDYASNIKAKFCRYNPTPDATAGALAANLNQDSCQVYNQPTTATMSGNQISCNYHASSFSYDGNAGSCTQIASTASTTSGATVNAKTDCAYSGTSVSANTLTTCTTVPQTANPSTNGVTSSGPAKACAFVTPATTTYPAACTQSGSASATGNRYDSYVTCALDPTGTTDFVDSCTALSPGSGPSYTSAKVVCENTTTNPIVSTDNSRTSCTFVAQKADASAPYKTCTYDSATTSSSVLAAASCTHLDKGTSGSGTYAGPAVSCAYDTTASATNTNAATCTPNRKSGADLAGGPAVDCVYNTSTSSSVAATSCSNHDDTGSTSTWNGAKIACVEGAAYGGWANVSAGNSCVKAGQSGPTDYTQWRDCQYTDPLAEKTYGSACAEVTASAGPSTFSVVTPVHCVAGSFTTATTVVPSIVDSCSTTPTQTGDTGLGTTQVNTATTCNYAATPTLATAISCTPSLRQSASPYTTEVTCTSTLGPWTKLAGSCSTVGVQPPISTPTATVPGEFAAGVNTACRTTDVTGTAGAFAKAADCTAGVDGALLQTQCSMLQDTPPLAVKPNTCVETQGLPTGPDYVKTTCQLVTGVSTVMNCAGQAPAAPLWKTTSCVNIEGSGTTDTLADVAAYYYYTDLRTSALGKCTGAPVPPALAGEDLCSKDDVSTSASDPLSTQHMTTFTLGLGASGYMNFSDKYSSATGGSEDYWSVYGKKTGNHTSSDADSVAADPDNGVCSWQASGTNCNWPYPASDEQTTIDDLWHAGVNGHGAYFSATDPSSLSASITSALKGVAAAGGAAAAPAISTPNLVPADNYVFSSTYTSLDWTGELIRRQLDPLTAAVSSTVDWAVQAKLDANTARTIYTFDASVAVTKLKPFTSANFAANANFLSPHISTTPGGLTQFLCASAATCLTADDQGPTKASGANLVNYLRGDRSNEGAVDNNNKYYRQRQHVLGDMVNSQVVYVTSPSYSFGDAGYTAFATAQKSRQAMVYAGANDGMLHAFAAKGSDATEALVKAAADAANAAALAASNTGLKEAADAAALTAATAVAADAKIGQELWAYIPSMVIPDLYRLADKNYANLHRYYVDATPVVGDICVDHCAIEASAVWKTILVGGLGGGGRGFYALDITDPANPKALWEFTDTNLGYSYGNPQIVKSSDGKWVVLLSSGYNNIVNADGSGGGDGVGRLYVLDAASGVQIAGVSPILTGIGDSTSPSGLVKITAQVVNPSADNTVEAVYGGDLLGNLWRFDINDTVGASGYDAQLLAVFKDGAGNPQPITSQPEVALIPNVNVKVVYVGTGRYLAASDASDTSQQSFYAIKDVRATGTTPATAIFDNPGGKPRKEPGVLSDQGFVRQVQSNVTCTASDAVVSGCTVGTELIRSSDYAVDFASNNGWFFDLTHGSERVNTDPALALGLLAFNTNAPTLAACDAGGTSYQYAINYLTGGPVHVAGFYDAATNTGIVGQFLVSGLASSVRIIVDAGGKIHTVSGSGGGPGGGGGAGIIVKDPPKTPSASITRRTAWRELIRE